MAVSFSPEFRLAAACAMWPPSDRRTEAIKAAATRPLDWTRFLRVARRHGVVGLVRDGLTWARPDMPPQIAEEISAQAATMLNENLAMAREALRLQRMFDNAHLGSVRQRGVACHVGLRQPRPAWRHGHRPAGAARDATKSDGTPRRRRLPTL